MEQEKDPESPFPREPWQRLLASGGGEPPETTDVRIRAAARRALRPRAARWWLPASLAASFLLAVMVVRWQYDDRDAPAVMTESDIATTPGPPEIARDRAMMSERRAPATPQDDLRREAPPAPRPELRREAPAPPQVALPRFTPEPDADRSVDRITVTGSRVRASEAAPQGSNERPADETQAAPTSSAITAAPPSSAAARQEREERSRTQSFVAEDPPTAVKRPTPEDWYAEIERLHAAGRTEEAERELERLKEAYPGWLERHLEQAEKR